MPFAGAPLPPASLRLLVSPVRLMSAFTWRVIHQHSVMQYDKLVDFIGLATDIVPELLSPSQRAQLTLGLRARVRHLYVDLHNVGDAQWVLSEWLYGTHVSGRKSQHNRIIIASFFSLMYYFVL